MDIIKKVQNSEKMSEMSKVVSDRDRARRQFKEYVIELAAARGQEDDIVDKLIVKVNGAFNALVDSHVELVLSLEEKLSDEIHENFMNEASDERDEAVEGAEEGKVKAKKIIRERAVEKESIKVDNLGLEGKKDREEFFDRKLGISRKISQEVAESELFRRFSTGVSSHVTHPDASLQGKDIPHEVTKAFSRADLSNRKLPSIHEKIFDGDSVTSEMEVLHRAAHSCDVTSKPSNQEPGLVGTQRAVLDSTVPNKVTPGATIRKPEIEDVRIVPSRDLVSGDTKMNMHNILEGERIENRISRDDKGNVLDEHGETVSGLEADKLSVKEEISRRKRKRQISGESSDTSFEIPYYLAENLLDEEYWIRMYDKEPGDGEAVEYMDESRTADEDAETDSAEDPLRAESTFLGACTECDQCPNLMLEGNGLNCDYCGCPVHRHGEIDEGVQRGELDDSLDSDSDGTASLNLSACGEDRLPASSQSDSSSDDVVGSVMDAFREGFQKYIRMEIFGERILLQPGNHIWQSKIRAWSSIEWTTAVIENTESSLVMSKVSGFLLDKKREEAYNTTDDLEEDGGGYVTLTLKLSARKKQAALLSESQALTRLDAVNMCLHQDWLGRCAMGIAPFSRFVIESYSAEGCGYVTEEEPGKIQATARQPDGIHVGIAIKMSFKEDDYAQIKGLIEFFCEGGRAEVSKVPSEAPDSEEDVWKRRKKDKLTSCRN